MRRHEAVKHRQPGKGRDADGHQRNVESARDEHDDWNEQDDAHLEKQRQPDQRGDGRDGPGQPSRRDAADHSVDHDVGAAAVGQQRTDHRAKRNQQADAANGRSDTSRERVDDLRCGHPGADTQHGGPEDQREERMDAKQRDQKNDGDNADERRGNEAKVAGRRNELVGEKHRRNRDRSQSRSAARMLSTISLTVDRPSTTNAASCGCSNVAS